MTKERKHAMHETEVLIAGAGPTGLVLALWLTRLGRRVRIVDRTDRPGTTSRALAVQARTLELYAQLGLAEEVVARGHKVPTVNLWARGARAAQLDFHDVGAALTPFSFLEVFPQDEHERLLIAHLARAGVEVERETELLGFEQHDDGVVARLRAAGRETEVRSAYLAGCDGARSLVRGAIGAAFAGGTYRQLFYVADVAASGPPIDGALHVDLDEADFLAVFPLHDRGHARLIGTVRDARADHADTLRFEDVSDRAIRNLGIAVEQVNWFSTYHVHHRVTDRFRQGRAFLLGDAAHIHSPAGGQGMNTGIGDAINLAWKLAMVLDGRADDRLLDSYEAERIGFARRLVATTDRAFSFASAEGPIADIVRTRIAPKLLSAALGIDRVRDFLFRTLSQIVIDYRDGPLSEGAAGRVHGGMRLPWVAHAGVDNHALAARLEWQVQAYGEAGDGLRRWCERSGVPLHVIAWADAHHAAGFRRGAAYLVRPDSYVAAADATGDAGTFEAYLKARGLRPQKPERLGVEPP